MPQIPPQTAKQLVRDFRADTANKFYGLSLDVAVYKKAMNAIIGGNPAITEFRIYLGLDKTNQNELSMILVGYDPTLIGQPDPDGNPSQCGEDYSNVFNYPVQIDHTTNKPTTGPCPPLCDNNSYLS